MNESDDNPQQPDSDGHVTPDATPEVRAGAESAAPNPDAHLDEQAMPADEMPSAEHAASSGVLPEAGATSGVRPCPHCAQPAPVAARRCPHCGKLLAGKKITRPEKIFAEEAGPAWEDAAQRVTELGGLEWETGVHPINEDTHPLDDTSPFADQPPTTPRPAAHAASLRPRARLWPLMASVSALMVVLAVSGLLILQRQFTATPSSVAAQATYEASQLGHSTTSGTGKDGYTPAPGVIPPGGTAQPTGTVHPHPTPNPKLTPTAILGGTPTAPPVPTAIPTPTATPAPQLVLAINAGGRAADAYNADMDVSGGNTYHTDAQINTSAVTNPAPQAVYDSERYGTFTYTLGNLQPGANYTVRLHFAEIYFKQPKQRIFNVSINNALVLDNFDIVAQAGGPDIAIVEAFVATADPNGVITISFTPTWVNYPKLSGLELYTAP